MQLVLHDAVIQAFTGAGPTHVFPRYALLNPSGQVLKRGEDYPCIGDVQGTFFMAANHGPVPDLNTSHTPDRFTPDIPDTVLMKCRFINHRPNTPLLVLLNDQFHHFMSIAPNPDPNFIGTRRTTISAGSPEMQFLVENPAYRGGAVPIPKDLQAWYSDFWNAGHSHSGEDTCPAEAKTEKDDEVQGN